MKILVDEMPETTKDCPYSCLCSNAEGIEWYSCTLSNTRGCETPSKCPVFSDEKVKELYSITMQ